MLSLVDALQPLLSCYMRAWATTPRSAPQSEAGYFVAKAGRCHAPELVTAKVQVSEHFDTNAQTSWSRGDGVHSVLYREGRSNSVRTTRS